MAFQAQKINPLDLKPSVAVGVDLPFSAGAVFNSTYETKDALKANLINYFLTNKGERYLNPDFGSDIKRLLFDNLTEEKIDTLEGIVARDIDLFFPRVRPSDINVLADPDRNMVVLQMKYSIVDTNIEDELIINFEQ
jgi:phage baseplate assembly protein W